MFAKSIDIEPTNRCNADCSFCPRDATPHQGLMTPEVFDQVLHRILELQDIQMEINGSVATTQVSFCGLGEPVLNRHLPSFISAVRAAGLTAHMSSNGALLGGDRGQRVIDAGLEVAALNISDIGPAYEEVYKLPWDKTLEAVLDFAERGKGTCEVWIVLVNHHSQPDHLDRMREFWRGQGIEHFWIYDTVGNRGGALELDYMQFESYPELYEAYKITDEHPVGRPICSVPFFDTVIGYDGNYYLCCQDWRKQAPLGNVFDDGWISTVHKRLEFTSSREPVCRSCSLDPINKLVAELRNGADDQAIEDLMAQQIDRTYLTAIIADTLSPGAVENLPEPYRCPPRKLIPLVSTN